MGSFQERSLQIAKSYISSVVYIDDQIFDSIEKIAPNTMVIEPSRNPVVLEGVKKTDVAPELKVMDSGGADPLEMTNAFGRVGIQCSFLQYGSEDDLHNITITIKKSDIIILDWQMLRDDGDAAIEILKSYCDELKKGTHLFIIWTAEPKLDDVREKIKKSIPDTFTDNYEESTLDVENSKVILCKRSTNAGLCSLRDGISVDKLPDFILEKFSSMNGGLVSNTLLQSITLIKSYSSWLLKHFNKSLDNAYLAHRAMCPNPDDGEELLTKMISDAFASLIKAGNSSIECNSESIGQWIDSQILKKVEIEVRKSSGNKNEKKDVSSNDLKQWQCTGYKSIVTDEYNQEHFERYQLKEASLKAFNADVCSCIKFSQLTYQKNHFDEYVPTLTLGAVVEKTVVEEDPKFFVCLQQRCDSVRIAEDSRDFLFLPILNPREGERTQGPYLLINDKTYCVSTRSFDIISVPFPPDNDSKIVIASKCNNDWLFKSTNGDTYKWLFDLKDLHAQRIAQAYTSNLSRVGLDESEWLRRKGNRKE